MGEVVSVGSSCSSLSEDTTKGASSLRPSGEPSLALFLGVFLGCLHPHLVEMFLPCGLGSVHGWVLQ